MFNNTFICELDIDVDNDEFIKIINSTDKNEQVRYHRSADDYSYTRSIRSKFPLLGKIFNIYVSVPFSKFNLHVDAHRKSALNFPIRGTEESVTRFYSKKNFYNNQYNEKFLRYDIYDPLSLEFEFTLSKPTLINNTYPHEMVNGKNYRLVISWGLEKDFESSKHELSQIIKHTN